MADFEILREALKKSAINNTHEQSLANEKAEQDIYNPSEKEKDSNLLKKIDTGLTALVLGLTLTAAVIAGIAYGHARKAPYENARVIGHVIQKGDRLRDYFKAENKKNNLNYKLYEEYTLSANDSDIESFNKPGNQLNPNKLIAGKTIKLLDAYSDNHVGK